MKLCSKCKKRPAVVFMSDMSNPNAEPQGLCLVCAKEMGIKPVDDMLKKMNISDEDITIAANAGIMVESVAGEVYSFVFCFSLGWLKSIHLDKKQHK